MKPLLLILIAFIMNACMMQPATDEDMNEMAKKSWSASGTLLPQSAGGAVSLQANFKDDPGPHTVQFQIDGPDQSAVNGTRRTIAELTWSVQGNSVTRRIDIVNGTSITGTAEAVRVKVLDASSGNIAAPYTVSIQTVKGNRPTVQQPPYFTNALVTIQPADGNTLVSVPSDAGVISVMVTVNTDVGTALTATDVNVNHTSGGGNQKKYSPLVETGFVPLASGTTGIVLQHSVAAPVTYWTVTFGIDG